jgi:zinc D-Ala-D-Ala carboxypeptidase
MSGADAEYFSSAEMACRCGCGIDGAAAALVQRLNRARRIYGKPMRVVSGWRCARHDAAVGGAGNHPLGLAADLACGDGPARLGMLTALLGAGFRRVGVASAFIHVDMVAGRPDSLWLYPPRAGGGA